MDRRLYKYVEVEQIDVETIEEIRVAFVEAGLHPEYDLEIDFPTDLPYDVFRPDESTDKQILLLDRQDKLHELSEVSDIVRSISGIHRGKHHLYYPQNKVDAIIHELPSHIRPYFS
jgi:HD superfamily phosphohydrolase